MAQIKNFYSLRMNEVGIEDNTDSTFVTKNNESRFGTPNAEDDSKKYKTTPSERMELYFQYLIEQAAECNDQEISKIKRYQERICDRHEITFDLRDGTPERIVDIGNIYTKTKAFQNFLDYEVLSQHHCKVRGEVFRLQQAIKNGARGSGTLESLLLKKAQLEDLKKRDTGRLCDLRSNCESLVRDLYIFRYITKYGPLSYYYDIQEILGENAVSTDSFLFQAYEILDHYRANNIVGDTRAAIDRKVVAGAIFQDVASFLCVRLNDYMNLGIKPQELGFAKAFSKDSDLGKLIDHNCNKARHLAVNGRDVLNELFNNSTEQKKEFREKIQRWNQDGSIDIDVLYSFMFPYVENLDNSKKFLSTYTIKAFVSGLSYISITSIGTFIFSFGIFAILAITAVITLPTAFFVSFAIGSIVLIGSFIHVAAVELGMHIDGQRSSEKKMELTQDAREVANLLFSLCATHDIPESKGVYNSKIPVHELSVMRDPRWDYDEYRLTGENWLMRLEKDAKANRPKGNLGIQQLVQEKADQWFAASENELVQDMEEFQIAKETRLDNAEATRECDISPSESECFV
jgi:hypothetical protein